MDKIAVGAIGCSYRIFFCQAVSFQLSALSGPVGAERGQLSAVSLCSGCANSGQLSA